MKPTYKQIANDWILWIEYVDPSATMTRTEFDAMSMDEKMALQISIWGPEQITAKD
jgi:hypothetical protein